MCTTKPFHIIVTDSNHNICEFIKRELDREGYTVSCVYNGIEILNTIGKGTSMDCLILDPELLLPYGHSLITEVLDLCAAIQVIIHTYDKSSCPVTVAENIHLVEKNASSIGPLKDLVARCREKFCRQ